MADDPESSFGKCYFDDSGKESPSRFIPCGNVNFQGHIACCQSGNVCLSSSACYDGLTGMTYRAGCTDESYADPACPQKAQYSAEAWLGYTYCNGTSNEWVGCDDNNGPATVTPTSPCWCPEETGSARIAPFSDGASLQNIMSLPTAVGAKAQWEGGNSPSTVRLSDSPQETGSASTSASRSGSGSSSRPASTLVTTTAQSTEINGTPTVSTAVVTSTVAADGSSGSSGTTGSTGSSSIGVGAALGVLAIVALIAWLLLRRRKERRRINGGAAMHSGKLEKQLPSAFSSPETPHPTIADRDELDGAAVGAEHKDLTTGGRYYGNDGAAIAAPVGKSELDAVDNEKKSPIIPSPRTDEFGRPRSELPAGAETRMSAEGRAKNDGGWVVPGREGRVYEKGSI
ncbi:uncharacterized protein AB675_3274 [Cyphellophora attinorum]|uniref:Uncharacterized protein n=1 Tax=Cyphellophora attinorum TaxID=1664694 RepID=A0A0N1HT20_9EURO|nr:uncharacterized protein AB675_3274 [Phialophora attinorum]KPI39545.1 hypothetical protein AB675_3274 [Phialophora attinorum]